MLKDVKITQQKVLSWLWTISTAIGPLRILSVYGSPMQATKQNMQTSMLYLYFALTTLLVNLMLH